MMPRNNPVSDPMTLFTATHVRFRTLPQSVSEAFFLQ